VPFGQAECVSDLRQLVRMHEHRALALQRRQHRLPALVGGAVRRARAGAQVGGCGGEGVVELLQPLLGELAQFGLQHVGQRRQRLRAQAQRRQHHVQRRFALGGRLRLRRPGQGHQHAAEEQPAPRHRRCTPLRMSHCDLRRSRGEFQREVI
jgi:hypothetical protein